MTGEIKQVAASNLKKGSYCILDGVACVVKNIQVSKAGKHGHAKARIEAMGIINNQKKIAMMPGHDSIAVPIIEKKNAQVLSINKDIANVMDIDSYETFDIKIPEELKGEVTEGKQVIYWIVLDEKIIKQVK